MKSIRSILAFAALCVAATFAGCSSDEPSFAQEYIDSKGQIVQGTINLTALSRYADGLADATYTLTDYSMYESYYSKWKEVDLSDLCGWQCPFESPMIIHGGRCWTHMRTFFESTGPTFFGMGLDLLRRARKIDYTVYVKNDATVNADSLTFAIGNMNCRILQADDNKLVLGYVTDYGRGGGFSTGEDGKHLHMAQFKLFSEPIEFGEADRGFDSEQLAYDWLIDEFRTQFGDSVNMNYYYAGQVIFDRPILHIDKIIAERQERFGKK